MVDKTLSDEATNPAVLNTDFIYTEKMLGGTTLKTTVQQLDDFINVDNVKGPISAANQAIPSFNGSSGKLIQNTAAYCDPSGNITSVNLTVNGTAQVNGPLTVTGNSILNTCTTGGAAQFNSTVLLAADPTIPLQAATKQYIDNATFFGDVHGPASSTDRAIAIYNGTTGKIIQNSIPTIDGVGRITLGADPVNPLQAATKQYVDAGNLTLIPSSGEFAASTAATFLTSGVDTVVTMTTECFDNSNSYSNVTGIYSCPVLGRYMAICRVAFIVSTPGISGNYFLLRLYENGVEKKRGYVQTDITLSTSVIPVSFDYYSQGNLPVGSTLTIRAHFLYLSGSLPTVSVSSDPRDSSLRIGMLINTAKATLITG